MLCLWKSCIWLEVGHALQHYAARTMLRVLLNSNLLFKAKRLRSRLVDWGNRHGGLGPTMLAWMFVLLFQCKDVVIGLP
jgi:hypothetical protein